MPATRNPRSQSRFTRPVFPTRRRLFRELRDVRVRSLLRSNLVVLLSLFASFFLSDFPHNQPNLWLVLPALTALAGTADTIRCMQPRWNFYHGGVLLCIYMDLMILASIFFFLLYPYLPRLSSL